MVMLTMSHTQLMNNVRCTNNGLTHLIHKQVSMQRHTNTIV